MLTEIAIAYSSIGKYDKAIATTNLITYKTRWNDGSEDNYFRYREPALKEIALNIVQAGKYQQALDFIKVMNPYNHYAPRFDTLKEIALQAAKVGKLDRAVQIAQLIEPDREKASQLIDMNPDNWTDERENKIDNAIKARYTEAKTLTAVAIYVY